MFEYNAQSITRVPPDYRLDQPLDPKATSIAVNSLRVGDRFVVAASNKARSTTLLYEVTQVVNHTPGSNAQYFARLVRLQDGANGDAVEDEPMRRPGTTYLIVLQFNLGEIKSVRVELPQ